MMSPRQTIVALCPLTLMLLRGTTFVMDLGHAHGMELVKGLQEFLKVNITLTRSKNKTARARLIAQYVTIFVME